MKYFLILLLFIFPLQVSAQTVVLRYTLSLPHLTTASHQSRPSTVTSVAKQKKETAGRVLLATGDIKTPPIAQNKEILPFKKLLTDEGAKTREVVLSHLSKYYSGEELIAADNILKKEAGYRYDAVNEIGCAGMVQACPASELNCPLTKDGILCQADFFVGYINRRYGSPSKAWEHHLQVNWY